MKKWTIYTLGFVIALIALGAVGMAGFRAGIMQSASFENFALQAKQNGDAQSPYFYDNFRGGGHHGYGMRGGNHMGYWGHGFGGGMFFSPLFGLLHLAALGLIGWFIYKWIKNSGWKLTKTNASDSTPADS